MQFYLIIPNFGRVAFLKLPCLYFLDWRGANMFARLAVCSPLDGSLDETSVQPHLAVQCRNAECSAVLLRKGSKTTEFEVTTYREGLFKICIFPVNF